MMLATRCVAADGVDGVAFSPDGKSVVIRSSSSSLWGDSHALQLFDIDSGSARWKHSGHGSGFSYGSSFSAVTFSAEGSLLSVGGSTATAKILDADDGHVVIHRAVPRGPHQQTWVETLISSDGTRLITVCGWKVRVYDVRSGAATLAFRLRADCYCMRYSPDGTRIAMLGEDGIRVWDVASFQLQVARARPWSRPRTVDGPIARLQNVPANTNRMQFGGCSHVVVTAGSNDSVIRVWDVASGTLTGLCDTAPGTKWLTLGDGCGRVALTSCTDGTLRVWDVTTGQERARLPTPQGFWIGAVNSDATKLATLDGGRFVDIWSIADGPAAMADAPPDDWCPRCGAG